uniref:Rap1 GTPase-GDP dissociation stimulator 1 n=1 Tax=Apteryx owenii TaxID=8824 RepID=A0A8B9SEG3_APTOW
MVNHRHWKEISKVFCIFHTGSPLFSIPFCLENLSQHLECLGLCGGDMDAEEQILESLNGILLALAKDILFHGYQLLVLQLQLFDFNMAKTQQFLSFICAEEMKKPCIEADLILTLIPLLESTDQEMLLHAGRAIGHICYGNRKYLVERILLFLAVRHYFIRHYYERDLQEELVKVGVITSLVRILTDYAESESLVHVDLLALCNLADLDTAKEALSKTKVAEQLVKQLRRAENHERLEIVFEVLQALAENDALKVQLVEAGVQEVLSEILLRLQGSSQAEATCIVKAASDLIVSLLLGDKSMLKISAKGCGVIHHNVGTWLASKHMQLQRQKNWLLLVGVIHQLLSLLEKHVESGDVSVQHAALSALRNLAIPVVNKVQMLEEGVEERIQALLRSEMPPVQFKLLGTLRMLADGQADAAKILGKDPMLLNRLVQWCNANDHAGVHGEVNRLLASILQHNRSQEVVKAIQEAQGVKHLVSMTTSEHVTMQNEALNALAIASAINLGIFLPKESQLVQSLHKLLQDENTSPEVKYNSMGLLCSLLNSGNYFKQSLMKGQLFVMKTQVHSNANVVKEAVTTLQILRGEPPH